MQAAENGGCSNKQGYVWLLLSQLPVEDVSETIHSRRVSVSNARLQIPVGSKRQLTCVSSVSSCQSSLQQYHSMDLDSNLSTDSLASSSNLGQHPAPTVNTPEMTKLIFVGMFILSTFWMFSHATRSASFDRGFTRSRKLSALSPCRDGRYTETGGLVAVTCPGGCTHYSLPRLVALLQNWPMRSGWSILR